LEDKGNEKAGLVVILPELVQAIRCAMEAVDISHVEKQVELD